MKGKERNLVDLKTDIYPRTMRTLKNCLSVVLSCSDEKEMLPRSREASRERSVVLLHLNVYLGQEQDQQTWECPTWPPAPGFCTPGSQAPRRRRILGISL